jgi:hypothetical protein
MSSTDDIDWEDYFKDYVRQHPEIPFTEVAEQIAEKLGIPLDDVVSDEKGGSIIDYLWDRDNSVMSATEYIEFVAESYQVTVKEILLHPVGKEEINNFYKRISSLEPDILESLLNSTTPAARTSQGAQPTANTSEPGRQSHSKSATQRKTKADHVIAFVKIPALIVSKMNKKLTQRSNSSIHAIATQVAGRLGQAKFRHALFKNYGCRCLITECTVPHVVESAHIRPYKSNGDFTVDNGLPLRSDLHMLFDQNLLAFHPVTLKVELHPKLMGTEYECFLGQALKVDKTKPGPNREALQERYDAFLKAQKTVDYSYADVEK